MDNKYVKLHAPGCTAPLRVRSGHFATNHSHINYYIDMTSLKARVKEAEEVARSLAGLFYFNTVVDTIVCLEGCEVVGAYLARELTSAGILSMNAHKTMYVTTPEYNSNSQMIFRDNILPMIHDKHILLLTSSITTGLSVNKAMEAIQYYSGKLQGIVAIFSLVDEINGIKVNSVFGKEQLPDYASHNYMECPMCRQGKKLDALVNAYGFSNL